MLQIIMNRDRAARVTYFLLRVVAGFLFIQTGGLILFGWFGGIPGQPGAYRSESPNVRDPHLGSCEIANESQPEHLATSADDFYAPAVWAAFRAVPPGS